MTNNPVAHNPKNNPTTNNPTTNPLTKPTTNSPLVSQGAAYQRGGGYGAFPVLGLGSATGIQNKARPQSGSDESLASMPLIPRNATVDRQNVNTLQYVHALLMSMDNDYKGKRTSAAEYIANAIVEMGGAVPMGDAKTPEDKLLVVNKARAKAKLKSRPGADAQPAELINAFLDPVANADAIPDPRDKDAEQLKEAIYYLEEVCGQLAQTPGYVKNATVSEFTQSAISELSLALQAQR